MNAFHIRKTPCGIIHMALGSRLLRFPICCLGTAELFRERRAITIAKDDPFFASLVPTTTWLGPVCLMERLSIPEAPSILAGALFHQAFRESTHWPKVPARELVDVKGLADCLLGISIEPSPWLTLLDSILLPVASAHGDLHQGNLLIRGGEPRLIDWSDYARSGCRYFDLIDYAATGNGGRSWTNRVCELFLEQSVVIGRTPFPLPAGTLTAYCLSRMAKEWRKLSPSARRHPRKREKYGSLLRFLEVMVTEESREDRS